MFTEAVVKINSIDAVKKFCDISTKQDFDIDIINGRYIVDAKSIMGIFSLNLTENIELRIHESEDKCKDFLNQIEQFRVR